MVGQQIESIVFVVYAGLAGHTKGQWLTCEELLIKQCPWGETGSYDMWKVV